MRKNENQQLLNVHWVYLLISGWSQFILVETLQVVVATTLTGGSAGCVHFFGHFRRSGWRMFKSVQQAIIVSFLNSVLFCFFRLDVWHYRTTSNYFHPKEAEYVNKITKEKWRLCLCSPAASQLKLLLHRCLLKRPQTFSHASCLLPLLSTPCIHVLSCHPPPLHLFCCTPCCASCFPVVQIGRFFFSCRPSPTSM